MTMSPPPARVLLLVAHDLSARSIAGVLSRTSSVSLVGIASNAAELLTRLAQLRPDVVVWDPCGRVDPKSELARIREALGGTPVVVLTDDRSNHALLAAMELGVAGFVHLDSDTREIEFAIRNAAKAGTYFGLRIIGRLLKIHNEMSTLAPLAMTERQSQILHLAQEGLSSREIGRQLSLSPKTVDSHKDRARRRVAC